MVHNCTGNESNQTSRDDIRRVPKINYVWSKTMKYMNKYKINLDKILIDSLTCLIRRQTWAPSVMKLAMDIGRSVHPLNYLLYYNIVI